MISIREKRKNNHLVNKETVSCQCSIVLFTNPSDIAWQRSYLMVRCQTLSTTEINESETKLFCRLWNFLLRQYIVDWVIGFLVVEVWVIGKPIMSLREPMSNESTRVHSPYYQPLHSPDSLCLTCHDLTLNLCHNFDITSYQVLSWVTKDENCRCLWVIYF